jgi:histidine decarboxylase
MGIKSDSIADSSLINIANPLPIQNNNISRNLDFTDQAEISVIKQFAKFYNYPESKLRGYVTSGGTEGNLACLWYGREYLAKFNHRNHKIVLYLSNQAHYSIIKIANILQLELRLINTDAKGNIDLNHFSNLIKLHKISEYNKPLIVVATIGTTELGGIDDIVSIKKILDQSKLKYVMHADAALLGAVLPIIEPYGPIDSIFDYVDSIAISGHKFFGTRSMVGIALAKLSILKEAFAKHDIHIKYINDKEDTTISGTRNASNILEFDYTLKILGLEKNSIKLNKLVKQSIKNAEYFYKELLKIYKNEQVIYNKNQFIVVFPKPTNTVISQNIKTKFDLSDVGTNSFRVCILPNVSIELIDQLLKSLQQTKN